MDELVQRLSAAGQPVAASRVNSATDLKESINRGYVLIKFTSTKGGTELGISLDETATDLSTADFEKGTGTVHLAGNLMLNYTKVRCIADIDVANLTGEGHLEVLE